MALDWKSNSRFAAFIGWLLAHETEHNRDGSVKVERDPNDAGGTTKYGIDQRSHPRVNIAALTEEGATQIYFAEWSHAPCDELPFPLGEWVCDVFTNGGPAIAWVQTAINATGADKLLVDGFCGPKTLAAAELAARDPIRLKNIVALIYQYRQARYETLAANRPSQRRYLGGWLNRNRDLKEWAFAQLVEV